jgi:hypothetical protein
MRGSHATTTYCESTPKAQIQHDLICRVTSNHALAALQGKSMATAWHDVGNIWHDDALAALQGKSMA